ncbi:unnamed protein product, partial [Tenebrio molitor]
MDYRHQISLSHDSLRTVRILGDKIYHFKIVKTFLKFTFCLFKFIILIQTYLFISAPNKQQFIDNGPFFFKACYVNSVKP